MACVKHWCDKKTGEEYWGGAQTIDYDRQVLLDWVVYETCTYEGTYTGREDPETLFQILKNNIWEDGRYEVDKNTTWMYTPVQRKVWITFNAKVIDSYSRSEKSLTHLGLDWGKSYSVQSDYGFPVTIYTDYTVVLDYYFYGMLVKRIG